MEVRELVARALSKDGHRVAQVATLADAEARLTRESVELIVLDLALPDGDGLAFCRRLRSEHVTIPILVLTARSAVPSRVAGLDAGADDFLGKPFAVAELRARVRALLRRSSHDRQVVVERPGVSLDFSARRAHAAGVEVPLTAREWALLELLLARSGRVVSRTEILDAIWGDNSAAAAASLEVIVGRVRKKLGTSLVRTVRGEGYAVS